MAQVVYTGPTAGMVGGGLFAGKKFWLSRGLPSRSHFIDLVKTNGGEIVPLEQAADIKIVDHFKKSLPPDSYSYTFIEQSVRHGELQSLEDHRARPEAAIPRPVASQKSAKGTRLPFSFEDDRLLYDWVTNHERTGGKVAGNQIYQQLELTNPRHPWQSWRDRWVKHLSQRSTPPQVSADHSTTLPAARSADQAANKSLGPEAHKPEIAIEREGEKVTRKSTPNQVGSSKELRSSKQQKSAILEGSEGPPLPISTGEHRLNGISPPSTDAGPSAMGMASAKRKQSDMGEEAAATARPAPRAAKRTRPRQKGDDGREVRSTPELDPSSPHTASSPHIPPLPEPSEGESSGSESIPLLGQVISQTLTEGPNSQPRDQSTQALLGAPTQAIDFELAEPEGGWDSLLNYETLPTNSDLSTQPSELQGTQALLQGPTQALDFELAEPEGGWDEIFPGHTLPQIISTSASQPPSQNTIDTERQLGAWIDTHVAAGASEDDALLALKCSSMHTGLAELVLHSLRKDEGVPEDVKGIWTEREDEALKGGDGRAIKMLEEKHGKEAFQMRWNFLTAYDQIDDEF
ncbi:MAG: hypothetical protein M1839_005722 [Geoglossum umbratile]|nr:MAG: hypothetical protein M1839_005722 [Geoglossum umbratile]